MEKLTKEGLVVGLVAEELPPKAAPEVEAEKPEPKAEARKAEPKAKAEKAKPVIKLA